MTKEPVEIIGLGGVLGMQRDRWWIARGHIERGQFAELLSQHPTYQSHNGRYEVVTSSVRHVYLRAHPVGKRGRGQLAYRLSGKSSGAFPATIYGD